MKKFTKLFLSCAAVAAVTASVATVALADGEVTATYADGVVTVTANYEAAQKTLLIVKSDVDLTTIKDSDVIQIDQETAYTTVPVGTLEDGLYTVYMGGAGKVYSAEFRVGEVAGTDIKIGDVNLDGSIATADATALIRGIAGQEKGTGSTGAEYTSNTAVEDKLAVGGDFKIGDVNLDGAIATADATALIRGIAGQEKGTGYTGTTVNAVAK